MGVLDVIFNIGKAMYEDSMRTQERTRRELEIRKHQYDNMDNQELRKKWESSTGLDKAACAMQLKERGYGNKQDVEERMNQYGRLNDRALYEKWKNSEDNDKIACAKLLKERGYGKKKDE